MENQINFTEIKKELVEQGMCTQEYADTSEKAMSVSAIYDRDGSIQIQNVKAGVYASGSFFRGIVVDVPVQGEDKDSIKQYLKETYGVRYAMVKID